MPRHGTLAFEDLPSRSLIVASPRSAMKWFFMCMGPFPEPLAIVYRKTLPNGDEAQCMQDISESHPAWMVTAVWLSEYVEKTCETGSKETRRSFPKFSRAWQQQPRKECEDDKLGISDSRAHVGTLERLSNILVVWDAVHRPRELRLRGFAEPSSQELGVSPG